MGMLGAWSQAPCWPGSHTGNVCSLMESYGGQLDDVAADAPEPAIVDLSSAGVGVPGQVLDVLERRVLGKEIRDHQGRGTRGVEGSSAT